MTDPIRIAVEILPHAAGLGLPGYATPGSSGVDLRAAVAAPIELLPGRIALVPTGLRVAIPDGFELQVRSRSGLALKHGVMVLNSPGTIDADYRGELQVILANLGAAPFSVERGLRIAQMVLCRVERIAWEPGSPGETERGAGGFGSTGGA